MASSGRPVPDRTASVFASTAALPQRPGVYRFRDERGRCLYVGRAADLRSRVRSYWSPLDGRRHLARMVARVVRVEAVVCQSRHEAAWLERSILERRMPPWNRTAGGQEVPVWLRVTDRGVSVEHRPERGGLLFGPYLGGVQARHAASALDQVYPFHYANARTGAEREMARVRGVFASDGPRMRAATIAVLSGDAEALDAARSELRARQESAVDAMDFERAATIQHQIEGLAWVAEPSRVLGDGPDGELHGWADGVMLTFERRGGSLCDWRVKVCTEEDASRAVDSTPVEWRTFASENAALAAALLRGASLREAPST